MKDDALQPQAADGNGGLSGGAGPIVLVRHPSPEAVWEALYETPLSEFGSIGGVGSDGQEVVSEVEEILAANRRAGVWGFAGHGRIQYWADPDGAPIPFIIEFFAHELSHLEPDENWLEDELVDDEIRAMTVGRIAADAYKLAMHVVRGEAVDAARFQDGLRPEPKAETVPLTSGVNQ